MNDDQYVAFLAEEVDELMGAGRVGLYEFIEILHSMDDPPEQARQGGIAEAALNRLLLAPDVVLEWHVWGESQPPTPASRDDVDKAAWLSPTEDPYLCVAPVP